MTKLLLVDFENVQNVDFLKLDTSFRIMVFLGANQQNLPTDLIVKSQQLGSRLEWRQVKGTGHNALDFFIAYELGRIFEKTPQIEVVVLSKDKGFNPLIESLKSDGRNCRRIDTLKDLLK